jgi:hypothetical protein
MKRYERIGIAITVVCLWYAQNAHAVSVRLSPAEIPAGAGDTAAISIIADTEGSEVNGIEGTLVIPAGVRVREFRDAGSVINFWIERPAAGAGGSVRFGGVTAGGFSGPALPLFSVSFDADPTKDISDIRIVAAGMRAALNDGQGTSVAIPDASAAVRFTRELPSAEPAEVSPPADITPPEPFAITPARDPSVAGGLWFIVFSTQDKGSGMQRYDMQETESGEVREGEWAIAKSPFVLRDQSRKSTVFVRAIDNAGNARTAVLSPGTDAAQYAGRLFWYILGGAGILVLFLVLLLVWRSSRHRGN